MRRQWESAALYRPLLSGTAAFCFTLEKEDFTVPAVGEFIFFGAEPAPVQPFFVSGEEFFFAGQQLYAHIFICTVAAGCTAKKSAVAVDG